MVLRLDEDDLLPLPEKGQMPTYVKAIIGLGVIAFFGITITLFAMGIIMLKENFGQEHAAKVASEIVELPDPLPEGWQYGVGIDVGYQKIVNVQYKSGDSLPTIVQFSELANHGQLSAKKMAASLIMPSVAGLKFEPEGRGEEVIGGRKAYYVREHCVIMGRESATEVAIVDLPGGRIMEIQSSEQGKDKFDPQLVKPLLDSIKSLGGSSR